MTDEPKAASENIPAENNETPAASKTQKGIETAYGAASSHFDNYHTSCMPVHKELCADAARVANVIQVLHTA